MGKFPTVQNSQLTHPIRILLIEDDIDDALILSDCLADADVVKTTLIHAKRLDDGLICLQEEQFDIVLLDLGLPDSQGLETLNKIRLSMPTIPVIVLTRFDNVETAILAVQMGVQDYIIKGNLSGDQLVRSILYAIERNRLLNERIQIELFLKKERNKAQQYLDTVGVMLISIGVDQKINLINKKGLEILKCEESEVIGKNWFEEFIPDGTRNEFLSVFNKIIDGEINIYEYYENSLLAKDGEEKTIAWHNTILEDESGHITGILCSGEDITNYRWVKESHEIFYRLFEIEKQNSDLIDLFNEFIDDIQEFAICQALGIRIIDVYGNIPYVAHRGFSQEFYELEKTLSIHKDQCICSKIAKGELDFNQMSHTEYGSFYINCIPSFYDSIPEEEKNTFLNVCYKCGYKSMALIPIRSGKRPFGLIHLADTRENIFPLRVISTLEIVATELSILLDRMQVEAEVFKLNQFLGNIIDSTDIWLSAFDKNGRVMIWNKAAEEISGFSREESIGHRKVWKWLYPGEVYFKKNEYLNNIFKNLNNMLNNVRFLKESELIIRSKDGKIKTISWIAQNLVDQKNNPFGVIIIGKDISKFKAFDDAKTSFISSVSHELRTPLTIISNAINIIEMVGELNEKQKHFLSMTERNIDRLTVLVNKILSFSELESERTNLEFDFVAPEDFIKESIDELRKFWEDKSINIIENIHDDLPKIYVDSEKIKHAISNLLDNAIKYTPQNGQITIEAQLITENSHNSYMQISISDTGVGISLEDQKRIFDKFERYEHSKSYEPGVGLGLTITKQIIESHDGIIWVESDVGKGSKFVFNIPIKSPETLDANP
jgi:PAS domain S-box-containing protein